VNEFIVLSHKQRKEDNALLLTLRSGFKSGAQRAREARTWKPPEKAPSASSAATQRGEKQE
jgi:hypothetical protein